jgi:small subunit ribosomal protein S15Ae
MSQDIVSDVLNEIMNAKKAKKSTLVITKSSKLLINILDLMKQYGYIDYELTDAKLIININDVNECSSIKPRYTVDVKNIDKYMRRYLPARNFGYVLISTSKGLMTHEEALNNKIGGSLIAYFY